ncbi:hypothetical protein [Pseudomonas syringae group genomosp. 3]|uniref:hypothetical protein n=1 Tax=Pseudomonas syringae group genomosp. 3 TaxID=251701 RepID=UPI000AC1C8B0|nr:hypothetical protein [Pseudomonas syringae group genomosp. 3]
MTAPQLNIRVVHTACKLAISHSKKTDKALNINGSSAMHPSIDVGIVAVQQVRDTQGQNSINYPLGIASHRI